MSRLMSERESSRAPAPESCLAAIDPKADMQKLHDYCSFWDVPSSSGTTDLRAQISCYPAQQEDKKLLPFARSMSPEDKAIERPCSAATDDERQQQRGPAKVRWPGVWVNENLDYRSHAEQGERSGPREQAEHQQDWKQMLRVGRGVRGDVRQNQRERIFGAEQFVSAVGQGQPAL